MSTKKIQLLEPIFPADPQAGQVLGVDADGNKVWVTQSDPAVPDWARQSTKPKYTASEVGALPADTVIPSIDGLASETYVNNAIAGVNAVPTSTTTDNSKVLSVVDGVPTWVTIDSIITIQKYYTGTSDPDASIGSDGDLYLKTT